MPWGWWGWWGPWPGRGPFSYLPPWMRPGWLFGRGACWWLFGAPWLFSWYAPYRFFYPWSFGYPFYWYRPYGFWWPPYWW
ncbi:MAG: hypothetical protein J7L98_04480 [Candidatus Verstraetearchaeota archaeon]|nr:hypothetical protein [Candidatus Verstraetearchaeota archaeon]